MTTTPEGQYKAGTYMKGHDVRVADNAKEAVALVFDGFVYQDPKAPEESTETPKAPGKPAETPKPTDSAKK